MAEDWGYSESIKAEIRRHLTQAETAMAADDLHGVGLSISAANTMVMTLMQLAVIRATHSPRIGGGVVVTKSEVE